MTTSDSVMNDSALHPEEAGFRECCKSSTGFALLRLQGRSQIQALDRTQSGLPLEGGGQVHDVRLQALLRSPVVSGLGRGGGQGRFTRASCVTGIRSSSAHPQSQAGES